MTAKEQDICLALGGVRYLPGGWDKRFGNNLNILAGTPGKDLTEHQREWMYRLLFKYRKQLPSLYEIHKNHPHCARKSRNNELRS